MPSKVYEFIMDSCVAAGLSMTNKILRTKSPAGEREKDQSHAQRNYGGKLFICKRVEEAVHYILEL